jgi:hypothetical protein
MGDLFIGGGVGGRTMTERTGGCLCGAVRYTIDTENTGLSGCSCEQCRRHTGSLLVALDMPYEAVTFTKGRPAVYTSSSWAERGFCRDCGSTLFYRVTSGKMAGSTSMAAGTLDSLEGMRVEHEVFADGAGGAYALAGEHERLSGEETMKKYGGGS